MRALTKEQHIDTESATHSFMSDGGEAWGEQFTLTVDTLQSRRRCTLVVVEIVVVNSGSKASYELKLPLLWMFVGKEFYSRNFSQIQPALDSSLWRTHCNRKQVRRLTATSNVGLRFLFLRITCASHAGMKIQNPTEAEPLI